MTRSDKKENLVLFLVLGLIGVVLFATVIRGPFSIDEINYVVMANGLRHGTLFVPGTEGLKPSKELVSFDPDAQKRVVTATPVFSVAPPLYGPIALPLLFLGWRGLVLLNIVSYLLGAFLVFSFLKSCTSDLQTRWLGLAFVLVGGYGIEYAQGVWPHMLSAALVVSAVYAASKVWRGGGVQMALLSGLIIGTATGIREQNIVCVVSLGLTMLLFARRKFLSPSLFAAGAAVPLSIIATMHYFRQGLWHPFPKVVAYSAQVNQGVGHGSILDPIRSFWIRVVDYSAQPEFTDPIISAIYRKNPESGAMLVDGIVKKSLLQSSPWVGLALILLVIAWSTRRSDKDERKRILRAVSLVVLPMILIVVMTGLGRTDGRAFNQRYFLEMIPLLAIALLIMFDDSKSQIVYLIEGLLGAGFIFAIVLMLPSHSLYEMALVRVPLALAIILLFGWILRRSTRARLLMPVALGLCLGWSASIHLMDDLPASRSRRSRSAALLNEMEAAVPNHSAVFTFGGWRDAAGALMLTRDVVVLDVGADEGNDSGTLSQQLAGEGRSVFVLGDIFPPGAMQRIVGQDTITTRCSTPIALYELVRKNRRVF